MRDALGRKIEYMRVSVTDRCNLRCVYCMPKRGVRAAAPCEILSYEEIEKVCRAAAALGIKKIRLTGGEPLVRRGLPQLAAALKKIEGIEHLALTTNGQASTELLSELFEAGLDSMNVSLDSLNEKGYEAVSGGGKLKSALSWIDAALGLGLPLKLNCVLLRGLNDGEICELAAFAFERKVALRFIELMPLGLAAKFSPVPNKEVLERLRERYPELREEAGSGSGGAAEFAGPVNPEKARSGAEPSGPAKYYTLPGGERVGFISPLSGKFCSGCNRIRLSSKGYLKSCLCYGDGADLRELLRSGASEEEIEAAMRDAILKKPAAHCFELGRAGDPAGGMYDIGG